MHKSNYNLLHIISCIRIHHIMHASCLPFLFLPPAGGDFAVDERQSRNRATGTLLHYALRVSSFATFFLSSSIH